MVDKLRRDRGEVSVVLVAPEFAHYKLRERLYSYENEHDLCDEIVNELRQRGKLRCDFTP